MRIAITGASGLLGANVATTLLQAGHEVVATHRQSSRIQHLSHLPIDWRLATLSDKEALTNSFSGCDWVFHCAASTAMIPVATPSMVAANIHGTANVIEACRKTGARLLHTSSVVTVGVSEDGVQSCTEDSQWNLAKFGLDDGYSITKRDSELLVVRAAKSGLHTVIVCPSFLIGPLDAKPSSGQMILEVASGRALLASAGTNNFVCAAGVAKGMLLAAERGAAGRRYILSGENQTYKQMFSRISHLVGGRPPLLAVPQVVTTLAGKLGSVAERFAGKELAINSTTAKWGNAHNMHDCSRAKVELGYVPGDLDRAILSAAQWFRDHGML